MISLLVLPHKACFRTFGTVSLNRPIRTRASKKTSPTIATEVSSASNRYVDVAESGVRRAMTSANHAGPVIGAGIPVPSRSLLYHYPQRSHHIGRCIRFSLLRVLAVLDDDRACRSSCEFVDSLVEIR